MVSYILWLPLAPTGLVWLLSNLVSSAWASLLREYHVLYGRVLAKPCPFALSGWPSLGGKLLSDGNNTIGIHLHTLEELSSFILFTGHSVAWVALYSVHAVVVRVKSASASTPVAADPLFVPCAVVVASPRILLLSAFQTCGGSARHRHVPSSYSQILLQTGGRSSNSANQWASAASLLCHSHPLCPLKCCFSARCPVSGISWRWLQG